MQNLFIETYTFSFMITMNFQPNTSDKAIIIKSVHQEWKKESLGVILQFSIYYAVVT